MTTANLSVGLHTAPALAALKAFKEQATAEMRGFKIQAEIDFEGSVKEAMKAQPKFGVSVHVNGETITKVVKGAINNALADTFEVRINTASLIAQVKGAIDIGLAGATLSVKAGATGTASSPSLDMKAITTQVGVAVADAVANQVGKAIQKVSTQKGGPTGGIGYSSTDPETGKRTSYRMPIDPDEAMAQITRENDLKRAMTQASLIGPDRNTLMKLKSEYEQMQAGSAPRLHPRTLLGLPSTEEVRSMGRQIAAQMREGVTVDNLRAASASRIDPRTLLGLPSTEEVRSMGRQIAAQMREGVTVENLRASSASRVDPRTLLGLPSVEEVRSMGRQIAAQMREGVTVENLRAASASRVDPRTLLGLPSVEEVRSMGRQIAAQMREGVTVENLRAASASRVDPRTLLGLPSVEEVRSMGRQIAAQMREGVTLEGLKGKSAGKVDARILLGLPSEAESKAMGAQVAAQMRAGAQDQVRAMQSARDVAQFKARTSGEYTNAGVKAAGVTAVVSRFGMEAATDFFKANEALLSLNGQQEKHRVAVKASTEAVADQSRKVDTTSAAYRRWKENMNDVHSASRGLAGSLGMLWVTWGNTTPIVAAAAIGAAMRSVFTVGKDLEYQLRFVSILANDAAIPIQKFGDTVRGSLALPTEAAQALRGLAQNGLGVRDAMQALPAILNLATAGEMELGEAALGATGVMAAFNLQVSDLGRIGDVFAKAAALSNTSVTGMVEAMKQASTVSDQYKVSLEETAATLAVMAKRNISGTSAGTAFRNMMVELATPHNKAKEAMKAVGLQLYDNSNQLRAYGDVLSQLRQKTMLMNEQGRLTFLNEMFGERGAKAANALLSDFALYGEVLEELKFKSKDFASSVSKALQETTQGKLKAMLGEFQLATTETFFKANSDVNYFIDTLRAVARSNEFQQFLTATAKAVTELTGFLIEHGKTVGLTIAAWMGFRILDGVVSGLIALRGAMIAAGVAAGGLRLAMLGVLGAATGGVALVAALAAEFIFLRKSTYESVEEQKKFNTQLELVTDGLNREYRALQDSNAVLARRNQLLREGKSVGEIDRILDSEAEKRKGTDYKAKSDAARANLAEQQRIVREYETWQKSLQGKGPRSLGDPVLEGPVSAKQYDYAKAAIPELQRTVELAQKSELDFVNVRMEKLFQTNEQANVKRRTAIDTFNRRLVDIAKESNGTIKTGDLKLSTDLVRYNKDEDFENAMARANEALNLRLRKFNAPDPTVAAAARAEDKSQARSLIAEMNRERQDLEAQSANSRKINASLFDEKSLGSETLALIENARARRESEKVLEAETRWRERFVDILKLDNLDPNDRRQYQDALAELVAKSKRTQDELSVSATVAQNVASRKERESAIDRIKTLEELRQKGLQVSEDLRRAAQKSYTSPQQQVANNATAKVDEVYQASILDAKTQMLAVQERLAFFQADVSEKTDDESKQHNDILRSLKAQLGTREAIFEALKKARDEQKEQVAKDAVEEYNRSLTAEAGFSRFWSEYRDLGSNSADFVYNAMKTSTDNMGRAFEQFGATGKLSSRSLINSIISDLGRLAAQSLWRQVLGMVMSAWNTNIPSGPAPLPGGIGEVGFGGAPIGFAKGGVMTPHGNLPLRQYAAGGVAHSAQVAVFGEGRKPEAYVPLEDGRTIPVTVDGAQSGGNVVSVTFAPQINIDSRSDQAQVSGLVQRALKSYHTELMEKLHEKGVTV